LLLRLPEACRTLRSSAVVVMGLVLYIAPVHAQQPSNLGLSESEQWVWTQMREGREANLNRHCATNELDPGTKDDAKWDDKCRAIRAMFLKKMLTQKPWRDELPHHFCDDGI
jgi:hypothetical protein